jgi:hypothetical protein
MIVRLESVSFMLHTIFNFQDYGKEGILQVMVRKSIDNLAKVATAEPKLTQLQSAENPRTTTPRIMVC